MACEGIGETRRKGEKKFFCVAKSDKGEGDYYNEKDQVVCSPEIQEICLARVIVAKNKRLSLHVESEKDIKIVVDTGR